MYELYDPCTLMFFYRNKHMMIDLGTGNNNKINWPMEDEQELIDIIEVCMRECASSWCCASYAPRMTRIIVQHETHPYCVR